MSSAENLVNAPGQGPDEGAEQYLSFLLEDEEYGVDILRVQEIKCWEPPTPIPNTPGYVQGVVNIRGIIVPVIDLRQRFNLEPVEYGPTTVVVVLKVVSECHERVMGLIVDGVSDVYDVLSDDIKPAPDFGGLISTQFVRGLAKVADDVMLIVLDTDKLLNADELSALDSVTE